MSRLTTTLIGVLLVSAAGGPNSIDAQDVPSSPQLEPAGQPTIVDLVATDYRFAVPQEIPAGWITFRMQNVGREEHVAVIREVDDTVSLEQIQELIPHWTNRGSSPPPVSVGRVTGHDLGGPGVLRPGGASETSVHLEPGVYLLLCGIRTPEGVLHTQEGMIAAFRVVATDVGGSKPETDATISLSSYAISTDLPISAGENRLDVEFHDASNHDIHVAWLEEGQTLVDAVEFMSHVRAPSAMTWLGGVEQMPPGRTSTFQVTLEPGRYALICHYHAAAGMAEELVIPGTGAAPPITNSSVNAPVVLDGTTRVVTAPAGRTPVVVENENDTSQEYRLHRLKPGFTEGDYLEFVRAPNLIPRWFQADPEEIPFYRLTQLRMSPGERQRIELELYKTTYFLVPFSREHFYGDRALTSIETAAIQKIVVR